MIYSTLGVTFAGRIVDIHARITSPAKSEHEAHASHRMPFVGVYDTESHEWYTNLDSSHLHPATIYQAGELAERIGTPQGR